MTNVFHYAKLTVQLFFKSKFPTSGLTYWRQGFYPWLQTQQEQPAVKHSTHVEYPSWVYKFDIKESNGKMFVQYQYSKGRFRGTNIPRDEQLQNHIYLVSEIRGSKGMSIDINIPAIIVIIMTK